MKQIVLSVFTIFAVVAITAGATQAVFSEIETIDSNTISTATVDIDLRSLSSGEISKPLNVTDLIPGEWTQWARAEIYNTSASTPVRVFFHVEDVTGDACGKTNLRVTTGHAGTDAGERANDVYNGVLNSVKGVSKRVEITGVVLSPTLPANTTAVIQQQAQLDSTANNNHQGTGCTWNEVITAETPTV